MEKEFNPVLIEDTAAWLFWTLAARNGFRHTLDNVLRSSGLSLLESPDREAIFAGYNLSELPDQAFADFCDAVARHAYRKSANEENLIGTVYQEDWLSGRSPSAEGINTQAFNLPLTVSGDNLKPYGTLCIRYPLPAVVIAESPPGKGFFRVSNTDCLGFTMLMYIAPETVDRITDGEWLITGIFHIPENVTLAGHQWTEVIPNAICAEKGMQLYGQNGSVRLDFHWSAGVNVMKRPGGLAAWYQKSALGRWLTRGKHHDSTQ